VPPWLGVASPEDWSILVVGGSRLGEELLEMKECARESRMRIVEALPVEWERIRQWQRDRIDLVVVDEPDDLAPEVRATISRDGVRLLSVSEFYERLTGKLPLEVCRSREVESFGRVRFGDRLSRVFSVIAALVGILLTLPLYPIIALAIWLDDSGDVFYLHGRVGKDGKPFRLVKFRTMKQATAESEISDWLDMGLNDLEVSRTTRVGRFLRRHRLDELPQLFNVVMGDLNAVGPRAEGARAFEERSQAMPGHSSRILVMPGMAGWGLLKTFSDVNEKLQFDMFYVKHRSFVFDLYIFFVTAWRILRGTLR